MEQKNRSSTLRKPVPHDPKVVQSAVDLRPYPLSATVETAPPLPLKNTRSVSANPRSSTSGRRVESPNRISKALPTPPPSSHSRHVSAEERGRRKSDFGLDTQHAVHGHGRVLSNPTNLRPRTAQSPGQEDKSLKISKRRSGFGLLKSRDSSPKASGARPAHAAWVVDEGAVLNYELHFLLNGRMVPELYDPKGDVLIHLFPSSTGRGPSFKIPQHILADSPQLIAMMQSSLEGVGRVSSDGMSYAGVEGALGNMSINSPGTPPRSPERIPVSASSGESIRSFTDDSGDVHLFFPSGLSPDVVANPTADDIMRLIDIRNLFGFLTAQKLVFTQTRSSLFSVLLSVAEQLHKYGFSNMSGDTFGEAVENVLGFLIEVEHLADVRNNPENMVRTIVLGEKLRCKELYNEAFAHAVGRYADLKETDPKIFALISSTTQLRLERAYLELTHRQKSVDIRLDSFDFPSLFVGIAASTTSDEHKFINFKAWKNSYLAMRKFVMSYYKDLHGQWPPRASSKKNSFVEGGLNRLVLKGLYRDLSQLYDFLVDRTAITTRGMDASDDQDTSHISPKLAALRRVLGEYDRSSPPVQPPIPFDVPLLPTIETLNPRFQMLSGREQTQAFTSRLPTNEVILIMTKSHNLYRKEDSNPFLDAFEEFERSEALGKSCADLESQRVGHWIFLYAVIQSLPLLVIDALGVRYSEGVEYFLCQPSLGNLPWLDENVAIKKEWYANKHGGITHMPADIVNHGVEAVYRRSHCWTVATKWLAPSEFSASNVDAINTPTIAAPDLLSPLAPPPGFADNDYGLASNPGPSTGSLQRSPDISPNQNSLLSTRKSSKQDYRRSIAFLERLPIPTNMGSPESVSPTPMSGSRNTSAGSSTADWRTSTMSGTPSSSTTREQTFDDILKNLNYDKEPQKKKKSEKKK